MLNHILKQPLEYSFQKVGIKGRKFSVKDILSSTGICIIETEEGHQTKILEHKCDFIYYILEGEGYFEIDNQKENFVSGDLVVIPAGSTFTYKGKCRMILITTPQFYPEQEETI